MSPSLESLDAPETERRPANQRREEGQGANLREASVVRFRDSVIFERG